LRYQGSCVVLDPKGELYRATSAWRAANVGPVYRWAPFDDGSSGLPCHGFNPLLGFQSEADADNLASVLFPKDARSPEFFADDAIACMKALMLWVQMSPAPERRNLVSVFKMACLPTAEFKALMERGLARSDNPVLVATAHNILGKSGDRGLPNLRDSLFAKISKWLVPTLLDSLRADDFRFEALKDQPATVYLEVPFDKMDTYAPVLRLMLQSALDGMLHNPVVPKIPVLFILDEFLQLGPYPQFRNAIRTHAGAGVRLWFFLQDLAGIEEHYPNGWKPFFNCAVQQFFGVNDPSTARMISEDILGMRTVAYRSTNASGNISGSSGQWKDPGNSGVNMSTGESIQFAARPLMTHDEIMALLSGWADE
ncbi:hypothetical protein GPROT1_03038, partial [Gammaproteobacteria bacterium]